MPLSSIDTVVVAWCLLRHANRQDREREARDNRGSSRRGTRCEPHEVAATFRVVAVIRWTRESKRDWTLLDDFVADPHAWLGAATSGNGAGWHGHGTGPPIRVRVRVSSHGHGTGPPTDVFTGE